MFRKLLTFEEAKIVISQQLNLKPLGEEETHLLDAHERVLAEDVVSASRFWAIWISFFELG